MYDYKQASALRRLARWTAATRLMAHIYIHIQQRIDQLVYTLTLGRTTLSSWVAGLPVIMLTTIGAKTGRRRTAPLLGLRDGEQFVLIASNYGQRRHPAWYHNLRANPKAWITVDGAAHEFEVRELSGEESERYFQQAVKMYPGFIHYRRWAADRRIPVIKLEPQAGNPRKSRID
jgi:deazaflavin-dependent oxidoreductase (nitroreductase family)